MSVTLLSERVVIRAAYGDQPAVVAFGIFAWDSGRFEGLTWTSNRPGTDVHFAHEPPGERTTLQPSTVERAWNEWFAFLDRERAQLAMPDPKERLNAAIEAARASGPKGSAR